MIIALIITILMSYPLSHIFMGKAMMLDNNLSDKKHKGLSLFFYLPILNFIFSFLYLIWSVIKFKRV